MDESRLKALSVSGFVVSHDKVLLLKRSKTDSYLPGYWEVPGGKVDTGEDLKSAVAREVFEESGLSVDVKDFSTYFSFMVDDVWHKIDLQFICILKGSNEVVLSKEHDEYIWVTKKEFEKNNFLMSKEMRQAILEGFDKITNSI